MKTIEELLEWMAESNTQLSLDRKFPKTHLRLQVCREENGEFFHVNQFLPNNFLEQALSKSALLERTFYQALAKLGQ